MLNIIKIDMGLYDHWALETNTLHEGKPTLISNTNRNKTVQEEPWDKVVEGRPYQRIALTTNEPSNLVILRARAYIGQIKYHLLNYNCEHFIRELLTGVAESKQLQKVIIGTLLGAAALYMLTKRRTF